MTFLNNGATAVDAVEVAIKVLEDKEITNAGFGSNLALDGTVECDATIVDHYGRSGAVGAVGCMFLYTHIIYESYDKMLILERHTQPYTPCTTCIRAFHQAAIPPPSSSKLTGWSWRNRICV